MDRDEKLILNKLLDSQRRANYIQAVKNLWELGVITNGDYMSGMKGIIEQEGFKCPQILEPK